MADSPIMGPGQSVFGTKDVVCAGGIQLPMLGQAYHVAARPAMRSASQPILVLVLIIHLTRSSIVYFISKMYSLPSVDWTRAGVYAVLGKNVTHVPCG